MTTFVKEEVTNELGKKIIRVRERLEKSTVMPAKQLSGFGAVLDIAVANSNGQNLIYLNFSPKR